MKIYSGCGSLVRFSAVIAASPSETSCQQERQGYSESELHDHLLLKGYRLCLTLYILPHLRRHKCVLQAIDLHRILSSF